jgi:hypothetical protein
MARRDHLQAFGIGAEVRLIEFVLFGASKNPPVQRWLRRHPRVHFHFIPTSSCRLNLVERWFGEITAIGFDAAPSTASPPWSPRLTST